LVSIETDGEIWLAFEGAKQTAAEEDRQSKNNFDENLHAASLRSPACSCVSIYVASLIVVEFLESFRKQDAHEKRLTRNNPGATIAPHNHSLVIDRHADRFG
jgi:hypothetical protein